LIDTEKSRGESINPFFLQYRASNESRPSRWDFEADSRGWDLVSVE
jgi:hypothetical protein